jgi:hypothetical protein
MIDTFNFETRDPAFLRLFLLLTTREGTGDECSRAAGDVRHNSVKRCASAVGEGAMAVMFVHRYRAEG